MDILDFLRSLVLPLLLGLIPLTISTAINMVLARVLWPHGDVLFTAFVYSQVITGPIVFASGFVVAFYHLLYKHNQYGLMQVLRNWSLAVLVLAVICSALLMPRWRG